MTVAPPYTDRVLRLFSEAPGAGSVPPGPGEFIAAEAGQLADEAWVRLEVRAEGGRVLAAAFRAWGCPHVIAAAALAAGRLPGLDSTGMAALDAHILATDLGAPAAKLGRLLRVEDCVRALAARVAATGR